MTSQWLFPIDTTIMNNIESALLIENLSIVKLYHVTTSTYLTKSII